jgi:hypothetical protein
VIVVVYIDAYQLLAPSTVLRRIFRTTVKSCRSETKYSLLSGTVHT